MALLHVPISNGGATGIKANRYRPTGRRLARHFSAGRKQCAPNLTAI